MFLMYYYKTNYVKLLMEKYIEMYYSRDCFKSDLKIYKN